MNLETIAQEAMDYLDKAGVAADYELYDDGVRINTEDDTKRFFSIFTYYKGVNEVSVEVVIMDWLKSDYPIKSPS